MKNQQYHPELDIRVKPLCWNRKCGYFGKIPICYDDTFAVKCNLLLIHRIQNNLAHDLTEEQLEQARLNGDM